MRALRIGGVSMEESPDMSRADFSVAYNGSGREDDHSIEVDALAPALLAFGKLLREASLEFNNDRSKAKILVKSDFKNKCFQIDFELIVSVYEHVKTFLGSDPVKTAKEILEWTGLLSPAGISGGGTLTYLGYLKWRKGRKVTSVRQLSDQDRSGMVAVTVEGDGNEVHVHNHVHNLSNNQKALKATRDTFNPIGTDGFDRLELKDNDTVISKFSMAEIEDIIATCNEALDELSNLEPDIDETVAWLSVYSPVFDANSHSWRFNLGREHVYVDISKTKIAEETISRGGINTDDSYQVRLEITTPITAEGKRGKPKYKILEVLKFIPGSPKMVQGNINFSNGDDGANG